MLSGFSFTSPTSEVLQEGKETWLINIDIEILKNVRRQLIKIFIFFFSDILLSIVISVVESIFYLDPFYPRYFSEILVIVIVGVIVSILLLIKRKIFCKISGFFYAIIGGLYWLAKTIFLGYIFFGGRTKDYYEKVFSKYFVYLVVFFIVLGSIGLRVYCIMLIKIIYKSIGYYEHVERKKEHAEFLEKLAGKMENNGDNQIYKDKKNDDDNVDIKFCDEEDIQEEKNENENEEEI